MTENGENTVTKRGWQALFGAVYAGLFLFLFLIKPVPEQQLRASIGIQASRQEVDALLKSGQPIQTLLLDDRTEVDDWAAFLLTKDEATRVSVASGSTPTVVLTVETRWHVRGGLIGKALDQMIGREARVQALTKSLKGLKAQAEHTSIS
jgi:hypothetical protein